MFHVPIMFVPSSVAGGQSFETAVPFLVGVLATSIVMTWVYRSTGRRVLLMILLHGAVNVWPGLVGGTADEVLRAWVEAVLLVLVASVVVARYGPDLGPPPSGEAQRPLPRETSGHSSARQPARKAADWRAELCQSPRGR